MLDANSILQRYQKAQSRTQTWHDKLQDCYDLTMPYRANFNHIEQSKGADKTIDLYDPVATLALDKGSQALQNIAFGPRQWNITKPNKRFLDGKVKRKKGEKPLPSEEELKQKCSDFDEFYFNVLGKSNYLQCINQAISEMFISTGCILVNPGTPEMPFTFTSIPLHEISVGPGPLGTIQDVYREYKVPVGAIKNTWPKAKLSQQIQDMINTDPSQEIEIIEGTEYHNYICDNKDYAYFVMEKNSDNIMVEEHRKLSPWLFLRSKVLSGELFGRGPLYDLLPSLKTVNKAMNLIIQAAGWNANPVFFSSIGKFTNNNTARVAPGSVIVTKPTQQNPVNQMVVEAKADNLMQVRETLINSINDAMNINPTGDPVTGDPRQTATMTNILKQESVERWHSILSRIEHEFINPFIRLTWHYMYMLGCVDEQLDDIIEHEYISPIVIMRDQQEVQKLVTAVEMMEQIITDPTYQPYVSSFEFDIEKVTSFVSKKLGVNFDVLRQEAQKQQIIQAIQNPQSQMAQQQQGQQSQSQQEPQQPMVAPQQPMQFQGMPPQ